jgi:predicted nucleotidyltransferase
MPRDGDACTEHDCVASARRHGYPLLMSSRPPDLDTISRALESARDFLVSLGVARIQVFGSVSRGQQAEGSDIDFLVFFAPGRKSARAFWTLTAWLEDTFRCDIDIVTAEGLSPILAARILAEARDVLRAA